MTDQMANSPPPLAPYRKQKFRLTKHDRSTPENILDEDIKVLEIENCFWKRLEKFQDFCPISGLQIKIQIESVEIVTNEKLLKSFESMKEDFQCVGIEPVEKFVFYGCQNEEAVEICKENVKIRPIFDGKMCGIILPSVPSYALQHGSSLVVLKGRVTQCNIH